MAGIVINNQSTPIGEFKPGPALAEYNISQTGDNRLRNRIEPDSNRIMEAAGNAIRNSSYNIRAFTDLGNNIVEIGTKLFKRSQEIDAIDKINAFRERENQVKDELSSLKGKEAEIIPDRLQRFYEIEMKEFRDSSQSTFQSDIYRNVLPNARLNGINWGQDYSNQQRTLYEDSVLQGTLSELDNQISTDPGNADAYVAEKMRLYQLVHPGMDYTEQANQFSNEAIERVALTYIANGDLDSAQASVNKHFGIQDGSESAIINPVLGKYTISSPYGKRNIGNGPMGATSKNHEAIDIAIPEGTTLVAPIMSKVVNLESTATGGKGGNQVVLEDSNGTRYSFLHLKNNNNLKIGQIVNQGDIIATSGNTGNSTGPHLHFAIRDKNGKSINPETLLVDSPTRVTNGDSLVYAQLQRAIDSERKREYTAVKDQVDLVTSKDLIDREVNNIMTTGSGVTGYAQMFADAVKTGLVPEEKVYEFSLKTELAHVVREVRDSNATFDQSREIILAKTDTSSSNNDNSPQTVLFRETMNSARDMAIKQLDADEKQAKEDPIEFYKSKIDEQYEFQKSRNPNLQIPEGQFKIDMAIDLARRDGLEVEYITSPIEREEIYNGYMNLAGPAERKDYIKKLESTYGSHTQRIMQESNIGITQQLLESTSDPKIQKALILSTKLTNEEFTRLEDPDNKKEINLKINDLATDQSGMFNNNTNILSMLNSRQAYTGSKSDYNNFDNLKTQLYKTVTILMSQGMSLDDAFTKTLEGFDNKYNFISDDDLGSISIPKKYDEDIFYSGLDIIRDNILEWDSVNSHFIDGDNDDIILVTDKGITNVKFSYDDIYRIGTSGNISNFNPSSYQLNKPNSNDKYSAMKLDDPSTVDQPILDNVNDDMNLMEDQPSVVPDDKKPNQLTNPPIIGNEEQEDLIVTTDLKVR